MALGGGSLAPAPTLGGSLVPVLVLGGLTPVLVLGGGGPDGLAGMGRVATGGVDPVATGGSGAPGDSTTPGPVPMNPPLGS